MSNEMKLLSILVQTGMQGRRNIPFMLVGYPGIGKTQIITQLCAEISERTKTPFPVEVFTAPQRMPEEIGGLPVPDYEKKEINCLPMRIGKSLLKAKRGLIFVDEYSSADQAMGGACMTMIQDGRLGDLALPHAVARGAAMNPPNCAANGRALTAPESNRFCWIPWKLELNDFVDYLLGGPGTTASSLILPEGWEEQHGQRSKGLVASYLRKHQAAFDVEQTMPKTHDANGPWASPRSWENTARLLAACMSVGADPASDLAYAAVSGCVGSAQATTFLGWFREMDLPDPEDMLKNPDEAQNLLPSRADKLQVALESAAIAGNQECSERETRWLAAWDVIAPSLKSRSDCAIYAAKILCRESKNVDVAVPKHAALIRDVLYKSGLLEKA